MVQVEEVVVVVIIKINNEIWVPFSPQTQTRSIRSMVVGLVICRGLVCCVMLMIFPCETKKRLWGSYFQMILRTTAFVRNQTISSESA
jgi:hypothetical protein